MRNPKSEDILMKQFSIFFTVLLGVGIMSRLGATASLPNYTIINGPYKGHTLKQVTKSSQLLARLRSLCYTSPWHHAIAPLVRRRMV